MLADAQGEVNAALEADEVELANFLGLLRRARDEIGKAVFGQHDVIDQLLISLICSGHVLLEGAPGVGKTLLVRTIAQVTGLSFSRIQFTPDLMPADVTGSLTLVSDDTGRPQIKFQAGPIFAQLVLADEINRATPKTQSALLEAMQEGTVSVAGRSMELPRPFFVLATQNPIEMEGTYQLPEAQIDRFLLKSVVNFPDVAVLETIIEATTGVTLAPPGQVLTPADLLRLQQLVRMVPLAPHIRRGIARFILATQPDRAETGEKIRKYVRFGVSPRGAQSLVLAAKGHALFSGRYNVSVPDLRAMLGPALRHRFQTNYAGEADGIEGQQLLAGLFDSSFAGK